jgi:hypothetical protein
MITTFDAVLFVVWCLISALNKKALIMAATLACYYAAQYSTPTNFAAFILCSIAFFYLSTLNVRFPLEFRKAFIAFGVVYFIGAVDQFLYYHFEVDTKFDRIQPYLITAVNAYVLAYLFSDWRRDNADGIPRYCAKCRGWVKLHIPILANIQEKKR